MVNLADRISRLKKSREIQCAQAKVFDDNMNRVAHGSSTLMALPVRDWGWEVKNFCYR